MEDRYSEFGTNLKQILATKGMTQKQLANNLGVSAASVSEWLSGKKRPRLKNIYEAAKCLKVNTSDLVDLDRKYTECHSIIDELFSEDKRILKALSSVSTDGKINVDGHWCRLSPGARDLTKSILTKVVNDSLLDWQMEQQMRVDVAGIKTMLSPEDKEVKNT